MSEITVLLEQLKDTLGDKLQAHCVAVGELTIEVSAADIQQVCYMLRDDKRFAFEQLIDVCGVDYRDYGLTEWQTQQATEAGFSRGVDNSRSQHAAGWEKPRFAVVYHLLSLTHNHRLRVRAFAEGEPPMLASVVEVWRSADWFEREAFDLYGILFEGHPDLRRILTDYGFVGHPFRKDFPLSGNVEMRYDAAQQRCVYEPVTLQPRTLVPKVIRHDNRYLNKQERTDG